MVNKVDKRLLVISYFCIFLAVYLIALTYVGIGVYLSEFSIDVPMPDTQTVNATTHALSSVSSSLGSLFVVVLVIFLILIILIIMNGFRSMSGAMS